MPFPPFFTPRVVRHRLPWGGLLEQQHQAAGEQQEDAHYEEHLVVGHDGRLPADGVRQHGLGLLAGQLGTGALRHHGLGQLQQVALSLYAAGGQGAADLADMDAGVVVDQGGDDGDAEGTAQVAQHVEQGRGGGISSWVRLAVATRESGTMMKGWPSARTMSDWISWGPA